MASGKFVVNLIFALVVAALALTAITSLYLNSGQPSVQPAQASGGSALPEGHPPIDLESRVEGLQQMIAREPQNPDYSAQLGNLYYDAGDYGKAAEYYRRSLNIRPRNPNVETDLASCLHYLGRNDESLEVLDNVLGYDPGFTQALFNKGIVLIDGKKDVRGGISAWEELLRSNPGYPQRAELERRVKELKDSVR